MDKKSLLNRINTLYKTKNINITNYLKEIENSSINTVEDVLISYDFQAGNYTKVYEMDPERKKTHLTKLIEILNKDIFLCESVLEVGVGEATSMLEILKGLNHKPKDVFGFDISWSRIKYARKLMGKNGFEGVNLFTGDLFNIPFADNSIDLLYTVHALEPNGGREEEALKELYRVSKKYVVLVEPCYEIASDEGKVRMEKLGYIKNLKQKILNLGYNLVFETELGNDMNPLNKAKIYIIEKNPDFYNEPVLCCPITKSKLEMVNGSLYSKDSLLVYPIIAGVPCLLNENAVVATKFLDFE